LFEDRIDDGATVDGVADLHQQSAEWEAPGQKAVGRGTGHAETAQARRGGSSKFRCGAPKADGSGPCPANVAGPGRCPFHDTSPEGKARMELARRQGGAAPRVRLGLPANVAEAVDLSDSAGQLAILTAATKALALGAISSSTAQAIGGLVKVAAGIVAGDQEKAIRELEERVAAIVVEHAPRGRQ
jgi:hypothetical protein